MKTEIFEIENISRWFSTGMFVDVLKPLDGILSIYLSLKPIVHCLLASVIVCLTFWARMKRSNIFLLL